MEKRWVHLKLKAPQKMMLVEAGIAQCMSQEFVIYKRGTFQTIGAKTLVEPICRKFTYLRLPAQILKETEKWVF
jgi:hypothetical protein